MSDVDGVPTDPASIEGVRQELIAWRNAALEATSPDFQGSPDFTFTVLLSHAIVMLAELKEIKEHEMSDWWTCLRCGARNTDLKVCTMCLLPKTEWPRRTHD